MPEMAVLQGWDLKRGYDAATKWSPAPDWRHASIERTSWSARPVFGLGQTLVSGNLEVARSALWPKAEPVGLWGIAKRDALVRIARDRALLVGDRPVAIQPGWNAEGGWAVSLADDAWFVFELSGDSARAVCAQATSADLEKGSPSAAVLFAGVTALLYRTDEITARLHVERGFAPYLWRWLETLEG